MMFESPVEQVKERVPILDLIGQRVKLTKSGRNFKGLCPFHSEKTPSFYVFPDRDNYHCFGCGQSGDVFTFVMRTENVEFGEALKILAQRAGIELAPRATRHAQDSHRTRMLEANAAAARYFQSMLFAKDGADALRYLSDRGVERPSVETFEIGWAPESWDALLTRLSELGFSAEELTEVGLALARESGGHYDRFRGRIMFPIRDVAGAVTGFGGRALGDQQPKYLNSSDSPVFTKGSSLYAIDRARTAIKREGVAVVVEGYLDAVVAHQAGIQHVVASLGTALTEEHLLALKRLAPRAVLALDSDAAGDAAALRTLEVLRATYGRVGMPVADRRGLVRLRYDQELDVRVARLPAGQDPDDIIRRSPEELLRLVADARPIFEVLIDAEVARAGDDVVERGRAADTVLDALKGLPNPVLADQYLRMLAERLSVDHDALRTRLGDLRRSERRRAARPTPAAVAKAPAARDWLTFEEYVLRLLLSDPERAHAGLAELSGDEFYRSDARAIFETMQRSPAEGRPDTALDGPLAEHAEWIVSWGADLPESNEADLSSQIELCLQHLRMLNGRREVALIAAHRRDLDREGDLSDWPRHRARVGELTSEIHRLERVLSGRKGTALARDWLGYFREEERPRRSDEAEPLEPAPSVAAAG